MKIVYMILMMSVGVQAAVISKWVDGKGSGFISISSVGPW